MPTLHLLGTGAAVCDAHRTTTMLAVTDGASTLVVDCGGDVVQRYLAAGLDFGTLEGLIVTHEHPDHVSGFPLFMERIWLMGRRHPIPVYGIAPALAQARRCFEAFDTSSWKDMPEIRWMTVPHREDAVVIDDGRWHVTAAPVVHPVPIIGLRIEHVATGRVVAYSCDTEPTDAVVRLGHGADVLVHEATGAGPGHTSPEQAADIARRAAARRLVLVHLPPGISDADLTPARAIFPDVVLGEELAAHAV